MKIIITIKLEHLRVFIAVAEKGSLADAGAQINRTPSAVSTTLSQIEEEIGGELFEGDRKSRLTHLGQFVLGRAKQAVSAHTNAILDIQRYSGGQEGLIRVMSTPSAATKLLLPSLKQLGADPTSVGIEVRDSDSATVVAAVRAGTVDFGIASVPENTIDLNVDFLLEDRFHLICPADHRLVKAGKPVSWSDIDPHEFIANGLCKDVGIPELSLLVQQSPLMIHNNTSLLAYVASGFGITLLPELVVLGTPSMCSLPLAEQTAARRLYLLSRHDETLSPLATKLMNIVRETSLSIMIT